MHGILHPHLRLVRPWPAGAGVDIESLAGEFLARTRLSAEARFEQRRRANAPSNLLAGECRTAQRTVSDPPVRGACLGTLVTHLSASACAAWAALVPGPAAQREAHVQAQLQLVLQDLAEHEAHNCLALTQSQCEVYDLDLSQLIAESLERTTFSHLRRPAEIHWEGTFVKSLDPPVLVLVASIDL